MPQIGKYNQPELGNLILVGLFAYIIIKPYNNMSVDTYKSWK